MTIKACKTAVRAGAVLAVFAFSGGAFADGGISESFEATPYNGKLTGNGTLVAAAPAAPGMGYPITTGTHTQALEIAGTVTYAEGSAPSTTGASMVDFMFKVEPTDELEPPTGDDIRVALAVDTNDVGMTTAPIMLWCKTTENAANAEWVSLGNFETGTWVRATLVLDYGSTKKCSVSLNGNPALNVADSSSKWFYFVNSSGSYVASITMVGSTLVDDFVVQHNTSSAFSPAGASGPIPDGSGVTYDYINEYGVTVDQATNSNYTCGSSGMTVAQKFETGLDPTTNTKFELQTMNVTSATSATVTFPGNKGNAAYEVTFTDGSGATVAGASVDHIDSDTTGEGSNTATLILPENKDLIYIHLRTK